MTSVHDEPSRSFPTSARGAVRGGSDSRSLWRISGDRCGLPLRGHAGCSRRHNGLMSNGFTVNALTMRVRRTLLDAWEIAERLGHNYVGTEHLLLALSRDPDGIAGQVLHHLGMADRVAEELERFVTSPSYGPPVSNSFPSQSGAAPVQGTPEPTVWFESDEGGNPRLCTAGNRC